MSCEPVYWKKPGVLFEKIGFNFLTDDCPTNRYNAFFRFVLAIFIIGVVMDLVANDFSLGDFAENIIGLIVIVGVMWAVGYFGAVSAQAEGFEAPVRDEEPAKALTGDADAPLLISSPGTVTTFPSPANPYMNVLVHEVKYNPSRGAAASVECPMIKDTLENYYRVQWWADPTDVFGKSQGQRQFYTMPSTSIPSDRQSFQDWLYLIPGKTCKEGNRDACNPGTNGGAIPWLSQPN